MEIYYESLLKMFTSSYTSSVSNVGLNEFLSFIESS